MRRFWRLTTILPQMWSAPGFWILAFSHPGHLWISCASIPFMPAGRGTLGRCLHRREYFGKELMRSALQASLRYWTEMRSISNGSLGGCSGVVTSTLLADREGSRLLTGSIFLEPIRAPKSCSMNTLSLSALPRSLHGTARAASAWLRPAPSSLWQWRDIPARSVCLRVWPLITASLSVPWSATWDTWFLGSANIRDG